MGLHVCWQRWPQWFTDNQGSCAAMHQEMCNAAARLAWWFTAGLKLTPGFIVAVWEPHDDSNNNR
jgi:hypothetical protein